MGGLLTNGNGFPALMVVGPALFLAACSTAVATNR